MRTYILFGQPGAGKTFIGKIMADYFGFYRYDGDQDMSQEIKDAIVAETVTDEMRNEFFSKLIKNVKELIKKHEKLVITQTFIKEKYREQLLKEIPDAKFVLISTDLEVRESRLLIRDSFRLPIEKWRKMSSIFEAPKIAHHTIYNTVEGEGSVKKQLQLLLK